MYFPAPPRNVRPPMPINRNPIPNVSRCLPDILIRYGLFQMQYNVSRVMFGTRDDRPHPSPVFSQSPHASCTVNNDPSLASSHNYPWSTLDGLREFKFVSNWAPRTSFCSEALLTICSYNILSEEVGFVAFT